MPENESEWTLETLYLHLTTLIEANDKRYSERFDASQIEQKNAFAAQQTAMQTALTAQKLAVDTAQAAAEKAVTKQEQASEKRFDSVNEFRNTLADQQRTLMPRTEAELLIKQLTEKIEANTTNLTTVAGQKSGAQNLFGYIVGAAGIALALIFHFIK